MHSRNSKVQLFYKKFMAKYINNFKKITKKSDFYTRESSKI